MSTAKDEVKSLLDTLHDNCTVEDVQYHLYVLEKIRKGEERAESEGAITKEQAEQRLRAWLAR